MDHRRPPPSHRRRPCPGTRPGGHHPYEAQEADTSPKPGKRGAPRGNQNARKHGFYSGTLSPDEQALLAEADLETDLQGEIALLRVKLFQLFQQAPHNYELQLRAIRTLAHLVAVQHRLTPAQESSLLDNIKGVLSTIGRPLLGGAAGGAMASFLDGPPD